jgi:hypothetical protein
MDADPYAESGELIDVLSLEAWQTLRGPIGEALQAAVPGQGPIVDVGAGTGLGTLVIADTLPDAEIIAVEPSPILRAVLLSRLAAADRLRGRVTVLAADATGARLPDRLGGAIAINMIGHLPPAQRHRFFTDLRPRLAPAAPLVVNLQPPAEVTTIPETAFSSVVIGRHTYQGSGAATPAGEDAVTWRMRYRILDADGTLAREHTVDYRWHMVSRQRLLGELAGAGYSAAVGELDVVAAMPTG